jgi:hypothetical protein
MSRRGAGGGGRGRAIGVCAMALGAWLGVGSTGFAVDATNGIDINALLGATRFYTAGFTGVGAVVANIEGGYIWNGHNTLTGVTTFIQSPDPSLAGTELGTTVQHATGVGQVIAGTGATDMQRGIAYGATLWSGAVAYQFNADGSFNTTTSSFFYPYVTAMQDGVNGVRASVVNSSFGYNDTPANYQKTVALDALVAANRTVFAVGAGDDGPGAGTVRDPALGFNAIVTGALGTDTSNPVYSAVSTFTSRGPSQVDTPSGIINVGDATPYGVFQGRAATDLVAPGQNLTVANYNGPGTPPGNFRNNVAGSSFATPMTAGAAALLIDAGDARFGGGDAVDPRVIKAVLMNSADKLPGWDNGQGLVNGVVTTTQALDYAQGAGRLDLNRAFDQYLSGTAGGPGTTVSALGWTFSKVLSGGHDDFAIAPMLSGGSTFTGTLVWFADRTVTFTAPYDSAFTATDGALSHLELQLWENTPGGPREVAVSNALFTTSQQFSFLLPETGSYFLRVVDDGVYSEWSGTEPSVEFALAWSGVSTAAVPEPPSLAMGAIAVLVLAAWLRRLMA